MTTLALSARSPRTRVLAVLVAVGALALASQFALPVPGTPVPITLQPLIVVLAGLLLGPADAGAFVAFTGVVARDGMSSASRTVDNFADLGALLAP